MPDDAQTYPSSLQAVPLHNLRIRKYPLAPQGNTLFGYTDVRKSDLQYADRYDASPNPPDFFLKT